MLYGRECISPIHWNEMGEMLYLDSEVVQRIIEAIENVRARMLASQSKWKSYVDLKCRNMEVQVEDCIFLRVSPWERGEEVREI